MIVVIGTAKIAGKVSGDGKYTQCHHEIHFIREFDEEAANNFCLRTNYELKDLINEPLVSEVFSTEKYIRDNSLGVERWYKFICSRLYPPHRNTTPIAVDFYRCIVSGEYICSLQLNEEYGPVSFYKPVEKVILTNLEEKLYRSSTLFNFPEDFLNILSMSEIDCDEPALKLIAYNLQYSPGHYVQDELPFTINCNVLYEFLESVSTVAIPAIFFTRGIGFNCDEKLTRYSRIFKSRSDIYEATYRGNYWFIPPNSTKYFSLDGYKTNYDIIRHYLVDIEVESNPSKRRIYYAFGYFLNIRNGYAFQIDAADLYRLSNEIGRVFNESLKLDVEFVPILDFRIYDKSLPQDVESEIAFKKLVDDCCEIFKVKIRSTFGMGLADKCSLLNNAMFGVYPTGSGANPFVTLINRAAFIHAPFIFERQIGFDYTVANSKRFVFDDYSNYSLCGYSNFDDNIILDKSVYYLNVSNVSHYVGKSLVNMLGSGNGHW